MFLDATTIFVLLASTLLVAAGALAVAWKRTPGMPAVGYWCVAYTLAAIGVILFRTRGTGPDFFSIDVANALILSVPALFWTSARVFGGRQPIPALVVMGAMLWLVACRIPAFYGSIEARVVFSSLSTSIYSLATAYEFWRSTDTRLWRVTIAGLAGVHGVMHAFRAATVLHGVQPGSIFADYWFVFLALQGFIFAFAGAFFLLLMSREKVERNDKIAAMVDPLTGIGNRRSLLAEAEAALGRARRRRKTVALVLLDLDRFKSINDTFGHPVGDAVLRLFCAVSAQVLGPAASFGRMGGEEFAVVLPDAGFDDARITSERIVAAFADAAHEVEDQVVKATVSAGFAVADGDTPLPELLRRADQALYRAKELGRNRAVGAPRSIPRPLSGVEAA